MLDALQERSGRHSPYDKIFLMKILLDNISKSDTPRFAISVLERQVALFKSVTEEDLKEYDDPMTVGEVEAELRKWREYIDIDGVTEEEWCRKYHRYLRFDPIERSICVLTLSNALRCGRRSTTRWRKRRTRP